MPKKPKTPPSVRPGRPAKDAGAAAPTHRILDAATTLFLVKGFASVSTDELSKAASVSKSTIYRHFNDMAGVMRAVVARESDRFQAGVLPAPASLDELRHSLTTYGTNLLELLNQSFCRQLDQMLHEQARAHPEIARQFYDAAYGRSHREITQMLADAKQRLGIALPASADVLADNLLSMWEGLAYVRARLGLDLHPFRDPKSWAAHCVEMVLGHRTVRAAQSL